MSFYIDGFRWVAIPYVGWGSLPYCGNSSYHVKSGTTGSGGRSARDPHRGQVKFANDACHAGATIICQSRPQHRHSRTTNPLVNFSVIVIASLCTATSSPPRPRKTRDGDSEVAMNQTLPGSICATAHQSTSMVQAVPALTFMQMIGLSSSAPGKFVVSCVPSLSPVMRPVVTSTPST